jgi:hypothetical protein
MQHIARQQPPRGMAAELAEREGAAAAEIGRDVEPAGKQDVAAHAAAARAADREGLPGGDIDGRTRADRHAVERRAEIGAGQADARGALNSSVGPLR